MSDEIGATAGERRAKKRRSQNQFSHAADGRRWSEILHGKIAWTLNTLHRFDAGRALRAPQWRWHCPILLLSESRLHLWRCRDDEVGFGWNGQPGRSRRQPAAESGQGEVYPTMDRKTSDMGWLVARPNGPVARSTQSGYYMSGETRCLSRWPQSAQRISRSWLMLAVPVVPSW